MRKRVWSLLLALAMCLSLLPAAVFAAETVDITPTKPTSAMGIYYIGTVGELYRFAQYVNEGNPSATA